MSKSLHFSDDLSLPLDAATQTFAFIARKGAGKTYAAGKLSELLIDAGVQVVVMDTVGNWYGLRIAADGKGAGLDIPVIGGLRGDVPLAAESGQLIADLVVDTGRSMVLDLSQFSLGDRKRFATAFGEQLWKRKKGQADPTPVHLVLEECQLIIPQFVGRDDARMVGIYEEIVRLGRNYGIGVSMITQRPQSVNKEVLTQTEALVVGQVNGVPERKVLKEWITHQGADAKLADELPGLHVGTMYVWSPQWLRILQKIKVAKKRTFDASSTPKVGEPRRSSAELKPINLDELKAKMSATIEKAKADDPRELRRQIAELRKLADAKPVPAKVETKTVDRPVITDKQIERLESLHAKTGERNTAFWAKLSDLINPLTKLQNAEQAMIGELIAKARSINTAAVSGVISRSVERRLGAIPHVRPTTAREPVKSPQTSSGDAIRDQMGKGERAVMTAIAQHDGGCTREQLTVLTGYKRSSRDTYLQRLRQWGFVDQRGDQLVATDRGIGALGSDFEPLPTGDALRAHWLKELDQGERTVLQAVIDVYPNAIERATIDKLTGYKRSSRDTYLQRLSSRRLVETTRDGVTASGQLFD